MIEKSLKNMTFELIHLADAIKILLATYVNISKFCFMIWTLDSPYYIISTEIMKNTYLDLGNCISWGSIFFSSNTYSPS